MITKFNKKIPESTGHLFLNIKMEIKCLIVSSQETEKLNHIFELSGSLQNVKIFSPTTHPIGC